ncbi:MAG TPA: helix-turn-helix domain-containing protein [Edaphocola sp.]|nr:helix-turn-helix domain-containing protein [Edaphocola sp.]
MDRTMQDDQNELFKLAVSFVCYSHQSLFLTGKAGTGKTTFLKYIKSHCHKKMAITAPTGVAAINAGGVTLHSFFQLPFGAFLPEAGSAWGTGPQQFYNKKQLLGKLRLRENQRDVIKSLELLIIDEVSMVRADLLDAIDAILRSVRRRPLEPFGGLQMLFIGDLYQLPPVVTAEEWQSLSGYYASPFFFDAKVLQEAPPVPLELQKIYRQNDPGFIHLLNQIRNNQCTDRDLEQLHQTYKPTFIPAENSGYITLTTHNKTAHQLNESALNRLPGKTIEIKAHIKDDFPQNAFPADEVLRLKAGAQIMFIKNDKGEKRRYFNGKIGIVKSIDERHKKIEVAFPGEAERFFVETETWDNIRYEYDKDNDELKEKTLGSFVQYPIRLAWAVTIHKSQGLTFDKAVVDAGRSFAPGQVYVALSRLTGTEGLVLHSRIYPESIQTDPRVRQYMSHNLSANDYAQMLDQAQMAYAIKLLLSAYDWGSLEAECTYHFQSFNSRQIPDKEQALRVAASVLDHQIELRKVAEKFRQTLAQFFQAPPYLFEKIRERNQAAADWFLKALAADIKCLEQHLDNQEGKSKVKKYVKDVQRLLQTIEQKQIQVERSHALTRALSEAGNIQGAMVQFLAPIPATKTEISEDTKAKKIPSKLLSLELHRAGKTIAQIAAERHLAESTIAGHLISFIPGGEVTVSLFISEEKAAEIIAVAEKMEDANLSKLHEALGHKFSFNELRAAMALLPVTEKVNE